MAIIHYMKDGSPLTRAAQGLAPKTGMNKKERRKFRHALKIAQASQELRKEEAVKEVLNGKASVH
jgi:5'-3' exonuclease